MSVILKPVNCAVFIALGECCGLPTQEIKKYWYLHIELGNHKIKMNC
jgi:hypothetical protein